MHYPDQQHPPRPWSPLGYPIPPILPFMDPPSLQRLKRPDPPSPYLELTLLVGGILFLRTHEPTRRLQRRTMAGHTPLTSPLACLPPAHPGPSLLQHVLCRNPAGCDFRDPIHTTPHIRVFKYPRPAAFHPLSLALPFLWSWLSLVSISPRQKASTRPSHDTVGNCAQTSLTIPQPWRPFFARSSRTTPC